LHRVITVPGISSPVIVSIDSDRVVFRLKGSQKEIETTWHEIIQQCRITFPRVPTRLQGQPFTFLQTIAEEIATRKKRPSVAGAGKRNSTKTA
jgi:hypothetical protein